MSTIMRWLKIDRESGEEVGKVESRTLLNGHKGCEVEQDGLAEASLDPVRHGLQAVKSDESMRCW